jgi:hypothetical protein
MIDIQLIYALMKFDEMLCRIILLISIKNRKKVCAFWERRHIGLGKPRTVAKLRGVNL